ncbi:MAG: aldo/keto reductase [Bacteroidaceae bacterium]|nr:aldo/keto reductase [Bacteroidaceae bacterium]
MNEMNRRDFLKIGGTATAAAALAACVGKSNSELGDIDPLGHHTGEIPTDKMTYRTNPKTGDKVSLLGYGMMRLPNKPMSNNALTADKPQEEEIDQEQVNKLVKFALDHGVNYFDTSPAYCRGHSEESTGIALKASGYDRSKYFIATKLSNFSPDQWSYAEGVKMFQNSLKYLQTDHIDYLLLHGVGMGGMENFNNRYINNKLLDYLLEQRARGFIRNLGFSYHGDVEVFDYLLENHDKYKWDFVQIQMNYVDWSWSKESGAHNAGAKYLYEELEKRGIPAVIMEPLLGGRLSKMPDHIVATLKHQEPENSVASWAFRYVGSKPNVLTALSGMTYMEHLEDNLRSFCPLDPLTDQEQEWLETEVATLYYSYPTIPCNDCKYCMPCPYGIDIPSIFTHYNKCVNKGNVPESMQAANYWEARHAFLVGYDRAVPKVRQADHCIGCRQCVIHCPQNIDIPRELTRIDQFVEKLKQNTL